MRRYLSAIALVFFLSPQPSAHAQNECRVSDYQDLIADTRAALQSTRGEPHYAPCPETSSTDAQLFIDNVRDLISGIPEGEIPNAWEAFFTALITPSETGTSSEFCPTSLTQGAYQRFKQYTDTISRECSNYVEMLVALEN